MTPSIEKTCTAVKKNILYLIWCLALLSPSHALSSTLEEAKANILRDPRNGNAYKDLLDAAYRTRKFDEVIPFLENLIAQKGDNGQARHALAYAYRTVGDRSKAENQWKGILQSNPSNEVSSFELASSYLTSRSSTEAFLVLGHFVSARHQKEQHSPIRPETLTLSVQVYHKFIKDKYLSGGRLSEEELRLARILVDEIYQTFDSVAILESEVPQLARQHLDVPVPSQDKLIPAVKMAEMLKTPKRVIALYSTYGMLASKQDKRDLSEYFFREAKSLSDKG